MMWVQSLVRDDSPGGGNGNQHWYSCLENPRDRGAWRATVHEVTKSQTRLNTHTGLGTPGPVLPQQKALRESAFDIQTPGD